jgi:diguanylate cyclase (GGDEF)-like protein
MTPVGIITTKDVFRILSSGGNTERPLREFMTGSVITIPTTASINEALVQLKHYRIKRAIVVSGEGYLLGVITQSQLVGYAYGSWIHILRNHTSELQELAEMLQVKTRNVAVLAVTDVLTGMGNQRLLLQVIREECNRIARYHAASFSLLIIGIDHFDRINQVCGHMVGDDVLKNIGKLLKDTLRLTDLVVRWSDEAFAVMLCNTPFANAVAFSSRLSVLMGNCEFANQCRVTVSIGVGEYVSGEAEHEFILRVENALSRAQCQGCNRVEQA